MTSTTTVTGVAATLHEISEEDRSEELPKSTIGAQPEIGLFHIAAVTQPESELLIKTKKRVQSLNNFMLFLPSFVTSIAL